MPGGRPTSRLDPIPASYTPLTGSEAAVPGEKRGPDAVIAGDPLIRTSTNLPCLKPQDLLERVGGGSQSGLRGEGVDLSHFTPQ